uniref:L-type lectin-like domain-containing protein n=1 Tax=Aplanochytrium stocchinoi TaxID=215587 RepID=A0A7S3PPA0_9STRA
MLVVGGFGSPEERFDDENDGDNVPPRRNQEVKDVFASHSFKPPFLGFGGGTGKRIVSNTWKAGGSTTIKENFVRLTPDRQSKQGWIFNDDPIEFEEFSLMLRFRISGQGKSLYGDGMGFWVQQKPEDRFEGGPLLGSTDKFYGFGILFDTFRNVESGHIHKDISLVQSDGKVIDLSSPRKGCSAKYRYWEGTDSFSADMHSRAKITLRNNIISVMVDKKANGHWDKCFTANLETDSGAYPPLNAGWIEGKHVHFGMSASTGALADNHDVLELLVTKPDMLDTEVQKQIEAESQLSVDVNLNADMNVHDVAQNVIKLAEEAKQMELQLKKFKADLEHKLESLGDNLQATISKLKEAEGESEHRIDVLEAKSKEIVDNSIKQRVVEIEGRMSGSIESRLDSLERRINAKVESVRYEGGSWKWPFIFFALLVAGALAYNYRSIRHINRMDKFL